MESILITGGCGFIGSNFIPFFLEKYNKYQVINLDNLTYASNQNSLRNIENSHSYHFIKGDICNRSLIKDIFQKFDIRGVIHFAAESHVDNSIKNPELFIRTNIIGTFTLLDIAKNFWIESPKKDRKQYEGCRFHHISTDEVFGSLGKTDFFCEESSYAPNSPYSASKASSDLLVRSYYQTYGLNTVISNSSNNYGPNQHIEKFIPTIILKALQLENIPIYGDGRNIRDWLYVLDHCKAIDYIFHLGKTGEQYIIGGRNEQENLVIAEKICEILDNIAPEYRKDSKINKYSDLIELITDRPGHDFRYAIDPTKIETELGWKPEQDYYEGLEKTTRWYLNIFCKKMF